jgi:hypothetical protein
VNADRRHIGHITLALLIECSHTGLIGDDAHIAITNALHHLQNQEYWQLQKQEKHEGKNASTDQQLAICRLALPALEQCVKSWNDDDFETVIEHLTLAITTDGTVPKRKKERRRK